MISKNLTMPRSVAAVLGMVFEINKDYNFNCDPNKAHVFFVCFDRKILVIHLVKISQMKNMINYALKMKTD